HRAIDMTAEVHTAFITIEERRIHLIGQHRADEQRVALDRGKNHVTKLTRDWRVLGDLLVALDGRPLITGGRAAVDPRVARLFEPLAHKAQLPGVQYLWNLQQHSVSFTSACRHENR